MTYHIDPESGFIRYQRSIQIRAGQEYCTYYESKEKADIHLVHRLYLDEKPWTLMSWEGVNPISKPSPITDLDYRSAIIRKIKGQESARDVKPAAKPPAPGVLIIEDNGVTARTKAWDNHLLQVQRASAALKLAKAAATAESKAEYDRIMARYFAEQKKRGNKQ